mgnify:CR=1 FL=1
MIENVKSAPAPGREREFFETSLGGQAPDEFRHEEGVAARVSVQSRRPVGWVQRQAQAADQFGHLRRFQRHQAQAAQAPLHAVDVQVVAKARARIDAGDARLAHIDLPGMEVNASGSGFVEIQPANAGGSVGVREHAEVAAAADGDHHQIWLALELLQHFDGDEWHEPDERARPQRDHLPIELELIVVEAVRFVPQPAAAVVIGALILMIGRKDRSLSTG